MIRAICGQGRYIMNTINYTKTINEYSARCVTLEGEGNFNLWKASVNFHIEPLRNRVNLLETHFNELAESQVENLLTSRRDTILKTFENQLFPGRKAAKELIAELADIEVQLSKY